MSRPPVGDHDIVEREEAVELLAGATGKPWPKLCVESIDVDDRVPQDHIGNRMLASEAQRLARTVVRLLDILACERGERAPEGWESTFVVEYEGDRDAYEEPYVTRWQRIADGIHCYAGHSENTHPKCWWNAQDRRNGNKIIGSGKAESLLEAIESADRAAKDPT